MAMVTFAEDDHIYLECKDHPRGPWCYQEAVEQHNQPELCENILKYWPKADGVHGWCYYQLAMKNKDCSLCDRIHAADIKKMCRLDVCN
ncbi:hypothetical protein [Desulfosarcina widdelii]|nr:hypothetical protein [Desulfosarcina widdelii]